MNPPTNNFSYTHLCVGNTTFIWKKLSGGSNYFKYRGENMKNLTRTEVLDRWLKSQGDMTLTPNHPDRRTDTDECKKCFLELLRRHKTKSTLKGVSR